MSCSAIMTSAPVMLRDSETVAEAATRLLAQELPNLPVVDDDDRYVGMFGVGDLVGLVVPRVALAGGFESNLRFVGDDPGDLRRKFAALEDRRVSEFANRGCATLDPDSPQTEAVRLFCRDHTALAVVEKASGRVVGMVSHRDVLRALIEPSAA